MKYIHFSSILLEKPILAVKGFNLFRSSSRQQKPNERIIIRPEDITIQKEETNNNGIIHRIQYLGDREYIFVKMQDGCTVKVKTDKNHCFHNSQKVKLTATKYYTFAASGN